MLKPKANAVVTADRSRAELLSKMNWIEKEKTRNYSARDISFSIIRKYPTKGMPKNVISVTYRNNVDKKISSTTYVQLCFYKNRCFFREADSSTGYKMSDNTSAQTKNKYTKVAYTEEADSFVGDYDLKYDEFLELYYIERV